VERATSTVSTSFLYMDVSTIIKILEMLNRREIEEAEKEKTMLTDFNVVEKELKKRLRSGEDLCFYRGSKLLTVRNFRLVTADFFSGEYRGGNCQVKGCCSFEYKQGDGWSYEGENSVYEVILQIDGDTIISIGNNRINVL